MHTEVDGDLHLTGYAISIFDRMSDASTIVQMKRLNVVAAELDRRARLAIKESRRTLAADGPFPLGVDAVTPGAEGCQFLGITEGLSAGLQWGWGNDGVEAWPGMDVSLVGRWNNRACKEPTLPINLQ